MAGQLACKRSLELTGCYQQHLGITPTPRPYDDPPWQVEAGITVFEPFPEATDYFGKGVATA